MKEQHETILLIRPRPRPVEDLQRLLASMNYRPITAFDAQTALQTAAEADPDLMLVDIGMQGFQLLKSLRQIASRAPIIALATRECGPIPAEVLQFNVRGCLFEPFGQSDLCAAIDAALRERRLMLEHEAMDERLLVAEAVQTTAVTLSHYLNNYLTALNGGLQLAAEILRQGQPNRELLQLLDESRRSSANIEAVMRVLVQVSNAQLASYSGNTRILDIETAVQREMEHLRALSLK